MNSFLIEIEAVFVLVIAEKFGKATPIDDGGKHLLRRLVGQQHREMFKHDFLGYGVIFLSAQQADEIAK